MTIVNSKEAQNHFGSLMSQVVKEPIVIQKYGKPSAVLIAYDKYEKFLEFEDLYWEIKAKQSAKQGFLSQKESDEFLNSILGNEE